MKTKSFSTIVFLILAISLFAQETSLKISVNNIRNSKGTVKWAVFKDGAHFNSKSGFADAGSVSAKKGTVTINTKNIPDGSYAISVYHDENNNSDVDFNFLGLPIEGFGFSQNPTIYFGPPKYQECVFTKKGNSVQNVKMKYYL